MKRTIITLIAVMMLVSLLPLRASSASKSVLISEVQTGSAISASEEFVEIYNSSLNSVDLSSWTMYYKSATGLSWIKKATITSGQVDAGKFWVLSANMPGDSVYVSGLSQTGGNLQIRDKLGTVMDQFGWGTANAALISPASESAPGQSMYRLYDFNLLVMQNTDNNFADYDITDIPSPGLVPAIELAEEDVDPQVYADLELSELLPDPASPLSDATDEFIEIYNPTAMIVDLSGWKLRDESGAEYLVKTKSILPNAWVAIMASESKITLNNTGDSIELIDPNGKLVDQSANYEAAEVGLSWSKLDGVWQWAQSPTPSLTNSIAFVANSISPTAVVDNIKKAVTKKRATKATTSTSKSTPKPKASKASKVKASSANSASPNAAYEAQSSPPGSSKWWTWLLVLAGVATIGYGVYEYRTEIHIFIKKLKAKLGAGPKIS